MASALGSASVALDVFVDDDNDDIPDDVDNSLGVFNSGQRDTDSDGFGTAVAPTRTMMVW